MSKELWEGHMYMHSTEDILYLLLDRTLPTIIWSLFFAETRKEPICLRLKQCIVNARKDMLDPILHLHNIGRTTFCPFKKGVLEKQVP